MAKRKDVRSIVEKLRETQAELERSRDETERLASEAIRAAYETLDPAYIANVDGLFAAVHRAATLDPESKSNAFRRNAGGMRSYLEQALQRRESRETEIQETRTAKVEAPEEKKQSTKEKGTPIAKAVEYLRSYDAHIGRTFITDGGYRQRIYKAAERGQLAVEAGMVQGDLEAFAKSQYGENQTQTPRKVPGVTERARPALEQYVDYRTNGHMSAKEVKERHPELCPPGKNLGKFFGSLEGGYRRYRASKRKKA